VEVQGDSNFPRLALSADGRTLVTANSNALRLCQVDGLHLRERLPLRGPIGPVVGLTFLPEGKGLATVNSRSARKKGNFCRLAEIRVWDLARQAAGKPLVLASTDAAPAVSPDGQFLAVATDSTVMVLDSHSGKPLARIGTRVTFLIFSPDSRTLAGRCADGSVQLWTVPGAEPRQRLTMGGTRVAFSPDGQRLASARGIYDVATGNRLIALEGDGHVAFRPGGQWLAFTGKDGVGGVWLADTRNGATRTVSKLGSLVCFSPDGLKLAWASHDQVFVAGSESRHVFREWKQLPGPVGAIAFTPDSCYLAVGNGNGTVYLLEVLPTGKGS
jgi:WD40 repeat protein